MYGYRTDATAAKIYIIVFFFLFLVYFMKQITTSG